MTRFFRINSIKVFFLTLVFLACNNTSFAGETPQYSYKEFKPFKMVFLPDIHLSFADKPDKILFRESMVIFQDVIKRLNQEKHPDFVVFGGDLTHNEDGMFSDMPMFLDIAADLNARYYAVFGDRDADVAENVSKEVFVKEFDEFDYETSQQTFWSAEPVEGVLLVGLDTSVQGKKYGYLNIHQLFWLDGVLKANRDKFTVIVMHHPPISATDADKDIWKDYTLEKPGLFLELIALYPQVKIILSGHHLNNYVQKINEKLFITCPSIAAYPNMYKILKVYPDRVEVENEKISFKQIIKKAGKNMIKSTYAKEFNPKKPKDVIKFQKGNRFSRKDKYYFGEDKSGFFR